MALKIYGLRKCSTCQKAMEWLDGQKIAYSFIDYSAAPLAEEKVAGWSNALGGFEKMINRAGYTWRGLPAAEREGLTETKAVRLALRHPALIRRPLIEHPDGTVTAGFSDKVRVRLGGK